MFRKYLFIVLLAGLAGLLLLSPHWNSSLSPRTLPPDPATGNNVEPGSETSSAEAGPVGSGPDWIREFFALWHEPYDAVLPPEVKERIWSQIRALPDEKPSRQTTGWELVGPSGIVTGSGSLYSGRVLDLNISSEAGTRVAAASGGLWEYDLFFPRSLTDELASLWIGSFDVHPTDPNTIIIGTGEPLIHEGSGIFKTTDGGSSWQETSISPPPSAVFRIRYDHSGEIVHLAADTGYYRSDDGGETWTRILGACMSDLVVHPWYDEVVCGTIWGQEIMISHDAGLTWNSCAGSGAPFFDLTRGSITIASSDPLVMYAAFAHLNEEDQHVLKGIYRSDDLGESWTDVTPGFNYMGKQGYYNNVIAVSPTDCNLVLAGGIQLMRSTDGGASWEIVEDDNLHPDYHALRWHQNGTDVWAGHDGGWSYSGDRGAAGSWDSSANSLPITQFVNIDVAGYFPGQWSVGGGSRDNGVSMSADAGAHWSLLVGGDGGGFQFWPYAEETIFTTHGVYYQSDLAFHRIYSQNSGADWVECDSGLDPCGQWYPRIRVGGDYHLYTNSCAHVYRADPTTLVWEKTNSTPFGEIVREMTVSSDWNLPIVYACLNSSDPDNRLWVKTGDYWDERSDGLPTLYRVRKVVPHPTDNFVCYALMNGINFTEGCVYRSDSRGRTWTQISSSLPGIPVSDLVVDPYDDDTLYLGTEFGCFRTTNGGTSWERWNYGMPEAVIITELRTLDLREIEGTYWIVAGTYGRSIWRRKIGTEDPASGVASGTPQAQVAIRAIRPNPANPAAEIIFTTGMPGPTIVAVHDLRGRLIRTLLSTDLPEGRHSVTWRGRDDAGHAMPAGLYIVRIRSGGRSATRKLMLAK